MNIFDVVSRGEVIVVSHTKGTGTFNVYWIIGGTEFRALNCFTVYPEQGKRHTLEEATRIAENHIKEMAEAE